jgi:hypothetical protein
VSSRELTVITSTSPKRKRIKYDQKFKFEYSAEFNVILKSTFGESYAFYTLCRTDISIAHGGRDDIRKHCTTHKHVAAESSKKSQPLLRGFFEFR